MFSFTNKNNKKSKIEKYSSEAGDIAKIWALTRIFTYKNMIILDVDCAEGINLKNISYTLPDAQIIGSDDIAKHVKSAQEYNKDTIKEGRMKIIKSPASKLPLKDDRLDLITAFKGMGGWKDRAKNLNEMRRILKKSGKLYILMQDDDAKSLDSDAILDDIKKAGFAGRGRIIHENRKWNLFFATK